MRRACVSFVACAAASPLLAAPTGNPFPNGIKTGPAVVGVTDFATVPNSSGQAPRMMLMVNEPTTGRMFVNDMRGPLHSVSYGGVVNPYLNLAAGGWGLQIEDDSGEQGFQSFAFHPDFNKPGRAGYGKFYTLVDTENTTPAPDFTPGGGGNTHDTVLLEWTANNPAAVSYDGGAPREVMRFEQPFGNHNGGLLSFNPLVNPGNREYGKLYISFADGGSAGDPLNLAQDLSSPYGKILRINPLDPAGPRNYNVPRINPYAGDGDRNTLGEIYASGLRNPQRFTWDARTGKMYVSDIGQGVIEEISEVTAGANLGWDRFEGSYVYLTPGTVKGRDVSDLPKFRDYTFPIAEYDHDDPLLAGGVAITLGSVYRANDITQIRNRLIFADFVSGEIFYIHIDKPNTGGKSKIRRLLLTEDGSTTTTLLELIRENTFTNRADLRFGEGPNGEIYLLNKHDGVIRQLVPDSQILGNPSAFASLASFLAVPEPGVAAMLLPMMAFVGRRRVNRN